MFKSLKEIFDSKESLLTKPNSKRDDSEDRKEGRSGSQTQTLALPLCPVYRTSKIMSQKGTFDVLKRPGDIFST